MIETWAQYTCDGCGVTEYTGAANETRKQVRAELRKYGWRAYGRLDYCRECVKKGNARKRITDMNH
ncbi:hypothetical protein HA052_04280 [Chromobacterium haemolyticum]|uniref:Uncharacterized protein n=1 Tax=Chromobacterium fluminis TaxID=3044269 RepID=A0ABX0L440_9NEIS|nr:hypothetical protein [Chromobacterium haemolyticum]NHR04407.1 hypothetical protein [Chromobacterium haemolyticum]